MNKSILITGANAGLGKETARQLAMIADTEKIYLGCRNEEKAKIAQADLIKQTGRDIFEILIIDVSNLDSVRNAVKDLSEPIDALIMNAGGTGGKDFSQKNKQGVMQAFATNLLGHVVLAEELLTRNMLKNVALYAGSEAARGVKEFGMKRPDLKTSSIEEFATIADGSFFGDVKDPAIPYGPIKYMGALWMSALARKYPEINFITMSPGATTGTNATKSLPALKRIMMNGAMKIMELLGKTHKLSVGAKRFVDGINDEKFQSGIFYASKSGVTGSIVDQGTIFSDLYNKQFQDNAYKAVHQFI